MLKFVMRVFDPDRPARFIGRRSQSVDAASSGRNQRGTHPIVFQYRDHFVYRVSFADAAGIEIQTGLCKENGSFYRIQYYISVTPVSYTHLTLPTIYSV